MVNAKECAKRDEKPLVTTANGTIKVLKSGENTAENGIKTRLKYSNYVAFSHFHGIAVNNLGLSSFSSDKLLISMQFSS